MVNEEALKDFWWFVNERHRIFLKKTIGRPKPWTEDKILQEWRFCNVFRKYDRQTSILIDNLIKPHCNDELSLMLFNIYAFRAFNWWPTYANLVKDFGKNGWLEYWSDTVGKDSLQDTLITNGKLTSGAYMIRGREGMPKYESIVQTLTEIWEDKNDLVSIIKDEYERNLQRTQELLMERGYWGWGPFTTYQIVLDLTYTKWLENAVDINTWCEFGPGAIRGIREIYPDLPKKDMLGAARGLLLDSPKFLEGHVPTLNLQDIEFCLCELQSYERVKRGGKKKERYSGNG